ncbi:MAG TPA: DUF2339 domain-containing protein [Gemmatimonadaceae bacterium]|nr:DUF2339 domain-containing protein [Gemmatimonadaceae bacterium]
MSDTERIERLEAVVRSLNQQLLELRSEVSTLRGTPRPAASGAAPSATHVDPLSARPIDAQPKTAPHESHRTHASPPGGTVPIPAGARPAWRAAYGSVPALDIEEIIGRYGTIALATLALLAGMGAFLTWAIAHGLLGPMQRVILGALGAATVGGIGWWLRARGTVRFGNTVLALSLALLHLDLWAAGPRLHVIPSSVALVIVAVASVALATLALRTAEEPLFCVGLGGALLAPFVTSTGGGSAAMLAAFGWVVIAGAIAAINTRRWHFAISITGAGCFVYAVAAQELLRASSPWPERTAPVLFALACAWAALAWGFPAVRARLALGFLVVAAGALLASSLSEWQTPTLVTLGLAGTITSLAAPRRGRTPAPWKLGAEVLLPVGFLVATVARIDNADSLLGALVALLWFTLACGAVLIDEDGRELHSITACAASAIAIFLPLVHHPAWCIVALAVHASLSSLLMRDRDYAWLAVPIAAVIIVASLWSYALILDRPAYRYTPFLTSPSYAALASTLAFWVFSRCAVRLTRVNLDILPALPALVAFVWIRAELAHAFSYDFSVFLLIVFYALAGIAAIFYGRRRLSTPARAVGLALACYAALKALIHAWSLSAIALRVGACLLAGAFIALVAYWYRGERDGEKGKETGNREQETGTALG